MSTKSSIAKVFGGIGLTALLVVVIGGGLWFVKGFLSYCAETNPTADEYVGIWRAYKAESGDTTVQMVDQDPSLPDEYLILDKGERAMILVGEAEYGYSTMEGRWAVTRNSRSEGTEAGVVVSGEGQSGAFRNPYQYKVGNGDTTYFVEAPLIEGHLIIDYGNRSVYLEKVSNEVPSEVWTSDIPQVGQVSSDDAVSSQDSSIPADAIEWTQAGQYIGEETKLYGKVVDAEYASRSNSQPTFLDIGEAYPNSDRLTVVIWGDDRDSFPSPPEEAYLNHTVAVAGMVYEHEGVCNIEVNTPRQIQIID